MNIQSGSFGWLKPPLNLGFESTGGYCNTLLRHDSSYFLLQYPHAIEKIEQLCILARLKSDILLSIPLQGAFLIYMVLALLGMLLFMWILPETKGKTLEQVCMTSFKDGLR